MTDGLLQNLSEDSLNRISFISLESDDEDPLNDSSPRKAIRPASYWKNESVAYTSNLNITSSSQINPKFAVKNASTHKMQPPLSLDRTNTSLFKFGYCPSPTESVQSFNSTLSLTPKSSVTELDSDFDTTPLKYIDDDIKCDQLNVLHIEDEAINKECVDRKQSCHRVYRSIFSMPHNNEENSEVNKTLSDINGENWDESLGLSPQRRVKGRSLMPRRSVWLPQAKVRRTQSMFATPDQMLHEQQHGLIDRSPVELSAAHGLDVLGSPGCPLPTLTARQDPFPHISSATLCRIMDGEFSALFSRCIVIDCRFEYEYEGGHIEGAININSKQQLEELMFHNNASSFKDKILLVFHCEHSAYRSPLLAAHLRHCDREINAIRYPNLYYPNVAVLEGGYSDFFKTASQRCEPQSYVAMNHREHKNACEREMDKFRTGMKARKSNLIGILSSPQLSSFRFPKPTSSMFRSASVPEQKS